MRLLLVRHGETVDNVAGLYAGSRDSPLTSHGMLQARRLGEHLAARSASTGPLLRVFASDLQRAAHTAKAVVDAHLAVETDAEAQAALEVIELTELRERHFGSSEGVKFSRSAGHPLPDAETHPEMHVRVERFIDIHLEPLFRDMAPSLGAAPGSVIVVAHGIILNVLLKVLLSRFAPSELGRLMQGGTGTTEYLVSWNNTAFVEALVHLDAVEPVDSPGVGGAENSEATSPAATPPPQARIRLSVAAVNSVEHLRGLKKTRGGIGSARFDSKQTTMDAFFKPAGGKST